MKIKIGDHVRFLNDTGEGKVVRILPGKIVEVRTSDGWDIPYPLNELIVMPAEEGGQAYKPESADEKPVSNNLMPGKGNAAKVDNLSEVLLLIAQIQDDGKFAGLQIHLVNDTQQNLDFIYYRVGTEKISIEDKDLLEPGTKVFLDELNLESLSSIKGWHIQGILSNKDQRFVSPFINTFIPFQTKKFASSGAFSENDYLHEAAIVIPLIPDENELMEEALDLSDIDKILKQKEKDNININKPQTFKSGRPNKPLREIDLHINQLVDSVVGMSNRDILSIQMDKFHKELNASLSSNESSIVFIHGIGNGTLKTELRKAIQRDYSICDFEDASFKEYGFGATMVRIRQNK